MIPSTSSRSKRRRQPTESHDLDSRYITDFGFHSDPRNIDGG